MFMGIGSTTMGAMARVSLRLRSASWSSRAVRRPMPSWRLAITSARDACAANSVTSRLAFVGPTEAALAGQPPAAGDVEADGQQEQGDQDARRSADPLGPAIHGPHTVRRSPPPLPAHSPALPRGP